MTWKYDKYHEWISGLIENIQSNQIGLLNFERALLIKFGSNPRTIKNHKHALAALNLIEISGGVVNLLPTEKEVGKLTAEEKGILNAEAKP
jgi:hypothetical protein